MYCRSPHRRCPSSLSLAHRQQCQAPARIRSSAAILGTVDAHSHISQRSSASFRAVSDNARKLEHFTPHYLSSIRQAPKKPSDTPVTATLPAAPCRCRDCASVGCRSPRDLRKKRTRMTTFAMQAGAPGAPAQDVGPPGQPAFAREPDVDARTRRCPRGADMRGGRQRRATVCHVDVLHPGGATELVYATRRKSSDLEDTLNATRRTRRRIVGPFRPGQTWWRSMPGR